MKKLLFTFVLHGLVLGSALAGPQSSSPPKVKAEKFFETVMKGKTDKAFDALFEGSPFAESKAEELQRMRDDFRKHIESGEVHGYEVVQEKAFGKSVLKLMYILKMDTLPLVWEFYFYKAKDHWILARVGFGEDLRKLGNGR